MRDEQTALENVIERRFNDASERHIMWHFLADRLRKYNIRLDIEFDGLYRVQRVTGDFKQYRFILDALRDAMDLYDVEIKGSSTG